jgi:hypothetical protein
MNAEGPAKVRAELRTPSEERVAGGRKQPYHPNGGCDKSKPNNYRNQECAGRSHAGIHDGFGEVPDLTKQRQQHSCLEDKVQD